MAITAPPTITALPTPPDPNDRSTFNTRAYPWSVAQQTFGTELTAVANNVHNNALEAQAKANDAAAQVGLAADQVTLAAAQANNAAASATTASDHAATALGHANTALSHANTAEGLLDQFDDRYLGAKSSDPALDNDGNALITGALYWNTSANEMRVWNGSAWQVAAGAIQASVSIIREVQTATASQTVFTLTNTYKVGTNTLMVYRNGSRLLNSEYTETNANTVTLASASNAGDKVLFEIGVVSAGTTTSAGLITFNPVGNIAATNVQEAIAELETEKQAALVSGTNIRMINGSSLLGSGNLVISGAEVVRVARTSNTQITSANRGNLIDITSGTFTQTFDAAATLGNGWFCYIRNSGTGDITLDPNASEQIDGLTSYVMYPGEVRLVQCDGTGFNSVVLSSFYRTFTTSGTFTKPPGYDAFSCYVLAGGGGGGAGSANGSGRGGNGGGGGGSLIGTYPSANIASSETITVGSGGAGGSSSEAAGSNGGNSSFGAWLVASGGGGGGGGRPFNTSTTAGVGGGTVQVASNPAGFQSSSSGADYPEYGGATRPAYTADNSNPAPAGGGSLFGGASGGVGQNENYAGGAGGISRRSATRQGGGGAGATANAGAGQDVTGTFAAGGGGSAGRGGNGGFGCGGGGGGCRNGTSTFCAGGAGGHGLVQVWGII